ncbi:NYN domain-containing protein [Nocardioides marmoriginsengisoli]|uniref:NYN domain-containing protein n=1 Tax=Nocardioides marmoriginsengisoli TaxID=661483 RepID=A0A3N0CJP3_9ACTN|nr:NYN domain-containing protein [Nocardioides marmoriginsengisoli]RNL63664.1 NYN domain-containing protein [Nocardioides marmoriginsengisoli]
MPEPQRVTVFLDWQNVYNHAREAFHSRSDAHTLGQVHPLDLGLTLAAMAPAGIERELTCVRVYRGMPDQQHDPKSYAAARRQIARWTKDERVVVIDRTLKYPPGYRHGTSDPALVKEKGIDVALALDFAVMASDNRYDAGILMSCDHDLLPAVERVVQRRKTRGEGPRVEFAAWQSPIRRSPRMRMPGENIYCHWLDQTTYWGLQDDRNYTHPSPADHPPKARA